MASAIYSAAIYRLLASDPRVTIANHLPINGPWECPVTEDLDGVSLPFRSAFYHVFRSFADGANATFVASSVQGSPTFDAAAVGDVPETTAAPVLLSLAVLGPEAGRMRVWVINRDLSRDVSARVLLQGRPMPVKVTVDVLAAPSADAMNTPQQPGTIAPTTTTVPPTNDVSFIFPAHSLVRLTFD
jgi:alpha-L-arabinofuranosidase